MRCVKPLVVPMDVATVKITKNAINNTCVAVLPVKGNANNVMFFDTTINVQTSIHLHVIYHLSHLMYVMVVTKKTPAI